MQQLKQTGLIFKDRYAGSFVDKRFNHKQVTLKIDFIYFNFRSMYCRQMQTEPW